MGSSWMRLLSSTSSNPQIDGQTEVVNRTYDSKLRAMVKGKLSTWEENLPLEEFAHNRVIHSPIGMAPF